MPESKYTGDVNGIMARDISNNNSDKPTVGYAHSLQDDEEAGFSTRMKHLWRHLFLLCRWIALGVIIGLLVGAFSTLFAWLVMKATSFRTEHWQVIFLLPFAGVLIAFLYKVTGNERDGGTNIILEAVHHDADKAPALQAPLIFIGTVLTHLTGGSAGREGAALQIGGSLGSIVGHFLEKIFDLDESERRTVVLCGMSAAFSAIFGTPMAAVVFPIEVISIGIMQYSALVPCAVASVTASVFAVNMGIRPEDFPKLSAPGLTVTNGLLILLLAVLAAWVSILFCVVLNRTGKLFERYLKNRYLRAASGGIMIIILTFAVQSFDYNGAGVNVIVRALNGEASPLAFLLKMLFTAITIEAGFKGGEIVPSFFIGATFGCVFGLVTGLHPQLCAAIGMSCVFCGVTNCPISTLLISFELFGFEGIPYYLLAVPVCYMMSEYYGLYKEQKIIYSKFRMHFINRKTQA
jgi:H+/Cl- antiporter ClcA